MIFRLIRNIKNILIKNFFFSFIISKIYNLYNNFYLNNDVKIYRKSKIWIHKTSVGLIPSNKPIFDPERYVKQSFNIFFAEYLPKKNDIVVELGAGIGCETLYISKKISDEGRIIALEPYDKIYNLLNKTIELNDLKNVVPINKALYKNSSQIGFSSDLDDWQGGKINNNSQNKILSLCLDDLVNEQNLEIINFCKINIEGAEKYITTNSDIFFDICKNISIECHDFLNIEEYKTFELIKGFLKSKNYDLKFNNEKKYPWQQYYIYGSK